LRWAPPGATLSSQFLASSHIGLLLDLHR
jgi:hypothetical protein